MKATPFLCLVLAACLGSCGNRDSMLNADIATKAKTDISFAGVRYTVQNGVARLWGNCPTDDARKQVEKTVKGIAGIRSVQNEVAIGPVVLDADEMLRREAADKIKKYPTLQASVRDSVITVSGNLAQKDLEKVLGELEQLHPKGLTRSVALP